MILDSYGVNERADVSSSTDAAAESLRVLGYCVIDGGLSHAELRAISDAFDIARQGALDEAGGLSVLEQIDEANTVRAPFVHDDRLLSLVTNDRVRALIRQTVGDYHVLSQQNGVINPPYAESYNQGLWHRDLPYQHVVFSRPLAVNALFCVDDFTAENGATLVLPGSHREEGFRSPEFIETHALQITAPAGSYVVLDCMCFHSGGVNRSNLPRRAVNQVYTAPILRQQIDFPAMLGEDYSSDVDIRRLLGYEVSTPRSVREFLRARTDKLNASESTS